MLSKINRIKKKKDFEIIFKNSKSFKNNLFILKIKKNNLGINRFGFVVSQKISKKATTRNKIRRRLAGLMRSKTMEMKNGIDLIIITLPGIEKKTFFELKEAVDALFVKSGLTLEKI